MANGEVIIDVNADTSKYEDKVKGLDSKTESMMGKAKGASTVLLAGVAALGAAVGGIAVNGIKLAGELEQNIGGASAVYGKYADELVTKSKTAYKEMGLSQGDYLQTANLMGSLFRGSGFEISDAMNMTSTAMQRAADVASIMGIDTSVAMESIAGAAKGNFTMMDNLGVAINDTSLNAYALEKGLGKTTKEMTNAEKVGLAMEMFLDRTAFATGNYAKENDTFAGSLTTLKANFANVSAQIGEKFLPILTDVFNFFNDFMANDPFGKLKELGPTFVIIGAAIMGGLMSALGPMIGAFILGTAALVPFLAAGALVGVMINEIVKKLGGWSNAWDAIKSAFKAVVDAAKPIIDMFKKTFTEAMKKLKPHIDDLKKNFKNVGDIFKVVGAVIGAVVSVMLAIVTGVVNGIINALSGFIQFFSGVVGIVTGIFSLIVGIFTGDGEKIKEAVGAIGQGIVDVFGGLWNGIVGFLTGFVNGVIGFFTNLWDILVGHSIVPDTINAIVQWFKNLIGLVTAPLQAFSTLVANGFNAVKDIIANIFNAIKSVITVIFNAIAAFFTAFWNGLTLVFSTALNIISAFWSAIWKGIKNVVIVIFEAIFKFINGVPELITAGLQALGNLSKKFATWFGNIKSAAVNKLDSLIIWVKGVPKKILGALGNLGKLLYNSGKAIIEGLWNGLKAMWQNTKSWISGIADWIAQHKGPISYDRKLLVKNGVAIMSGFSKGLSQGWSDVQSQIDKYTTSLSGMGFASVANTATQLGASGAGASASGSVLNYTQNIYTPVTSYGEMKRAQREMDMTLAGRFV